MAEGMYGANTDELRWLGDTFKGHAEDLDACLARAHAQVDAVDWLGDDAIGFKEVFSEFVNATRGTLVEQLSSRNEELFAQAEAQDEASAARGGGSTREGAQASASPFAPVSLQASLANSLFGDFDPIDWVLGTAEQIGQWTWDHIGVPVVNGLASIAQAALDNPFSTVETLIGMGVIALGASGTAVGVIMVPTGLVTAGGGTVAGAVTVDLSIALMATGAGMVAHGGNEILNDAVDNPQQVAKPSETQTYKPSGSADQPARPASDVLGEMPAGKNAGVRTVPDDAALQRSFDEMARGGEVFRRPGYPGEWVRTADGTEIGLRSTSKSGGRTIDVRHPDGTVEKVHIEP